MAITFKDGLLGNQTISFEMVVCANCKVPFMLQENHIVKLRKSGDTFHCPNGHSMVYANSCDKEKAKLEAELKKTQDNLSRAWEIAGQRNSEIWELKDANR